MGHQMKVCIRSVSEVADRAVWLDAMTPVDLGPYRKRKHARGTTILLTVSLFPGVERVLEHGRYFVRFTIGLMFEPEEVIKALGAELAEYGFEVAPLPTRKRR